MDSIYVNKKLHIIYNHYIMSLEKKNKIINVYILKCIREEY
jgi:hypothetical protein